MIVARKNLGVKIGKRVINLKSVKIKRGEEYGIPEDNSLLYTKHFVPTIGIT